MAKGERHIHCSETLPDERCPDQVLTGFRGKGVDVVIIIDAPQLAKRGRSVFRSAAGVLLIPDAVPVEFIRWVQVLLAGLCIYKRPDRWRLQEIPHKLYHMPDMPCRMAPRTVDLHEMLGTYDD